MTEVWERIEQFRGDRLAAAARMKDPATRLDAAYAEGMACHDLYKRLAAEERAKATTAPDAETAAQHAALLEVHLRTAAALSGLLFVGFAEAPADE